MGQTACDASLVFFVPATDYFKSTGKVWTMETETEDRDVASETLQLLKMLTPTMPFTFSSRTPETKTGCLLLRKRKLSCAHMTWRSLGVRSAAPSENAGPLPGGPRSEVRVGNKGGCRPNRYCTERSLCSPLQLARVHQRHVKRFRPFR